MSKKRVSKLGTRIKWVIINLVGYEETMQYGMISYVIPMEKYPTTYNKKPLTFVSLASQKNYIALYLMNVYGDEEEEFKKNYIATGKKLDMGKSCVRFKSLDDLPLKLISKTITRTSIAQFIERYEKSRMK